MKRLLAAIQAAHPKVKAGGGSAALAGLIVWLANHYWLHHGVPAPVTAAIYVIVPGVMAFIGGWLVKHEPQHASHP